MYKDIIMGLIHNWYYIHIRSLHIHMSHPLHSQMWLQISNVVRVVGNVMMKDIRI